MTAIVKHPAGCDCQQDDTRAERAHLIAFHSWDPDYLEAFPFAELWTQHTDQHTTAGTFGPAWPHSHPAGTLYPLSAKRDQLEPTPGPVLSWPPGERCELCGREVDGGMVELVAHISSEHGRGGA